MPTKPTPPPDTATLAQCQQGERIMIDVSRYFTQDKGDDTVIIVEANGKTIRINDNEAIQLIKELFKSLGDNEQRNIAVMFESWLRTQELRP